MNILITGGAGGIGSKAINYILENEEAANIHVVDKDEKRLKGLRNDVEKHLIDVRNYAEIMELSKNLEIDVLVNCAGYQAQGAIEDMSMTEFENHIQTNYLAAVNCTKAFMNDLKNSENDAKIINISSVAGKTGMPFLGGYCASKYALEGFTDALRKELLHEKIQVILVEPGRVKTGFNEKGVENMKEYVLESEWSSKYESLLEKKSFGGISEEKAGKKLGKIILKNRNKPRHTINKEAPAIKWIKAFLPTGIYDRLVVRLMAK